MIKTEKREAFCFYEDVANGVTETLEKTMKKDCRVKKIYGVIPDGTDGDLHLSIHAYNSLGSPIDLINYVGSKKYINGNNRSFEFDIDVFLPKYSKIVVSGTNNDTNDFVYPMDVAVSVEYMEVK